MAAGMTEADFVAADPNLIRHPTTRRYLTAIEDLRGRRVAILPMVDRELRGQLPMQAGGHIQRACARSGKLTAIETAAAARAAGAAALEWWMGERTRNSTAYMHLQDLGEARYGQASAVLPEDAFADDSPNDRLIYAQAWTHGVDVLASRNRHTIVREELEAHFAKLGYPRPPVTVRNLYEHTCAIAVNERRERSDIALEAMLAAVVPNSWTPDGTGRVIGSCEMFIRNLTDGGGTVCPRVFGGTGSRGDPEPRHGKSRLGWVCPALREGACQPPSCRQGNGDEVPQKTRAAMTQRIGVDIWG